jgi:hypothetical protein
MTNEHLDQQPEESAPQLTFLRMLLITTFIGSGWFLISFFFCGIFFDSLGPAVKASPFAQQQDIMLMLPRLLAAGRIFFLINTVLYALSLFGAIQMWKLRKSGFHFYALSQITMLITTMLFLHEYEGTILPAMLTGIFIFSYASNLRFMK